MVNKTNLAVKDEEFEIMEDTITNLGKVVDLNKNIEKEIDKEIDKEIKHVDTKVVYKFLKRLIDIIRIFSRDYTINSYYCGYIYSQKNFKRRQRTIIL